MKTNNKIFKVVLALVAIFVLLGYGFVFKLKLDEPLFFHHYYDQRVYVDRATNQDIFFTLGYITDVNDDKVVSDIVFPESPELVIQASEYGYTNISNWGFEKNDTPGDIYGRYSVRNINCKITELPDIKDLVITKARIRFNDSTEMTVDIGEIHFYEYRFLDSLLENITSSSSSDGSGKTNYRILGNLTITAIESPLMEKVQDRVHWQVNGKNPDDSVGMRVQEGNILEVTSQVELAEDIISEYTRFDIQPKLTFTDDKGTHYFMRIYNINSLHHNYSFGSLYKYIKAREAN